ncbi:MAG: PEFG-CTERM sorting domain-containing protein [Thaumarchaeota archaeon]|nr:PEFG-CTERM sorting domain-containing protein [Nitrososphaerota archaeon]
MKTKAICSFFVLFAIVAGIGAPAAFAQTEVTIATADDSGYNMECGTDCFTPSTVTVDVGGKVIFSNAVGFHTFTAGTWETGMAPSPSGEFDVTLATEETAEWIPDTVGEVPYYCALHVWMTGTIIVQEAAAEEETVVEDKVMTEDEVALELTTMEDEIELMVTITDSVMGDGTHVYLEFSEIHVNYEITAMQNGETVLQVTDHAMEMTGANHHIDAVGSDENPIDIEIVSLGIGPPNAEDDWTGPTGIVSTTQVVPEFGTIAMMVLAVAIISIIAVTAKSRVIPRF